MYTAAMGETVTAVFKAYRLSLSKDFYAAFVAVSACFVPVSPADVLARSAFRAVGIVLWRLSVSC